jgi:hypothetical protein
LLKAEFATNAEGVNEFMNNARDTGKIDLTKGDRELQQFKKKADDLHPWSPTVLSVSGGEG